MIDLNYY